MDANISSLLEKYSVTDRTRKFLGSQEGARRVCGVDCSIG
jgi:hypothetical protein